MIEIVFFLLKTAQRRWISPEIESYFLVSILVHTNPDILETAFFSRISLPPETSESARRKYSFESLAKTASFLNRPQECSLILTDLGPRVVDWNSGFGIQPARICVNRTRPQVYIVTTVPYLLDLHNGVYEISNLSNAAFIKRRRLFRHHFL